MRKPKGRRGVTGRAITRVARGTSASGAPPRTDAYSAVTNVGQLLGKEAAHIGGAFTPSMPAAEFLALARAKHTFLVGRSASLQSPSLLQLLEARARLARNLIAMREVFDERLNAPGGFDEFTGVAWAASDPLAGMISVVEPFPHVDVWQEHIAAYEQALATHRRRQRLRRERVRAQTEAEQERGSKPAAVTVTAKELRPSDATATKNKGIDIAISHYRTEADEDTAESAADATFNLTITAADVASSLVGAVAPATSAAAGAATAVAVAGPILSLVAYFYALGQAVEMEHQINEAMGVKRGVQQWGMNLHSTKVPHHYRPSFEEKWQHERNRCDPNFGRLPVRENGCWLEWNLRLGIANDTVNLIRRKEGYKRAFTDLTDACRSYEWERRKAITDELHRMIDAKLAEHPGADTDAGVILDMYEHEVDAIIDQVYLEDLADDRLTYMRAQMDHVITQMNRIIRQTWSPEAKARAEGLL